MTRKVIVFSAIVMFISAIAFMGCGKKTGGSSNSRRTSDGSDGSSGSDGSGGGGVSPVDSSIEVTVLTPGTPITDYIDGAGDVNWYSVEMIEGAAYCVQTFNLSADMDTVLLLLDVDGSTLLVQNDNCDEGEVAEEEEHRHSSLCFVAPATGTYYILVAHVDPEAVTGMYDLLVQEFLNGECNCGCYHADNGVGNGEDPQPNGDPPTNDGPGTGPGDPGNN